MKKWRSTQRSEQWKFALDSLPTLSYQSHDLNGYLQQVIAGVNRFLNSDRSILTVHEGSKEKIIVSGLKFKNAETEFSIHASVSEVIVQSGKSFWIQDIEHHPVESHRMAGYVCYLGVPLRSLTGEIIGTICSFSTRPQSYNAETIATVEFFAAQAATAIDRYRLCQQQQRFNELLEHEVSKRTTQLSLAQANLIQHERLAATGELVSMIVHEIRNPLTTVKLGLDYFAKLDLPEPAKVRLALARDDASRLIRLLKEISSYSKPQKLRLVEINLDSFIRELLISLRSMPQSQGRSIEYMASHPASLIVGDLDKLRQVFIHLIRNACEAVEPGSLIQWSVTKALKQQICISVHNSGTPIPADILPKLTQPFFSTKSAGTGLGLAIVKRIVEAHNGELLIESSAQNGTLVSVQLPLKSEQQISVNQN